MADTKITALTPVTTMAETDLLPVVADVSTTPVTKKVTYSALMDARELFSIVPATDFSLTAGTSAQNALPTTGDVFTLTANSSYFFEGQYEITKSGTTCTLAMLFALGGGASLTSISYSVVGANVVAGTTGATLAFTQVSVATAVVVNATATTGVVVKFSGIIRTNAGGTVTPQIQFSASPTSPVMKANSHIKFTYIGTDTANTKGAVA